jgi:D-glycero-alpha-D-manno-heptose-7-phosphate kinase
MIISKTPLRISLFGGGTDFPEYFNKKKSTIIGTTINKYIYITFSRTLRFDNNNIKIFYKNNEFVNNVKKLKHNVVKKILIKERITNDLDLHIVADLPSYSGLGTSSAFTVGLMNLLKSVRKINISEHQLAKECINFERNILGETVGFQDQIHAAYGGFNKIEIYKKNIKVTSLDFNKKKLEKNLFLVFTGLTRKADDIEKKKIKRIKINFKYLDKINEISEFAYKLLKKNKIDEVGKLLAETWELKKKLIGGLSNKTIDDLYEKGISAGASGGKLLGAGAGGFLLFYVESKYKKLFLSKMKKNKVVDFEFSLEGSKIINI